MPRLGRYFVEDQPLHVVQRGNDRQAIFFERDDYVRYLGWLGEAAAEARCAIHAYVLMTNHVHLLVTPGDAGSLPYVMQCLGRRYVRYVNDAHRRTGTLWEGRYKASPVDSDAYLMRCYRYVELNPVRAAMVAAPQDYPWSSYRANGLGEADPLVSEHALFRALGATAAERREAYRASFADMLDAAFLDEVRAATNGGWALGSAAFRERIAAAAGRRAAPLPRGRPLAGPQDKRQLALL
jgi:putative transposase